MDTMKSTTSRGRKPRLKGHAEEGGVQHLSKLPEVVQIASRVNFSLDTVLHGLASAVFILENSGEEEAASKLKRSLTSDPHPDDEALRPDDALGEIIKKIVIYQDECAAESGVQHTSKWHQVAQIALALRVTVHTVLRGLASAIVIMECTGDEDVASKLRTLLTSDPLPEEKNPPFRVGMGRVVRKIVLHPAGKASVKEFAKSKPLDKSRKLQENYRNLYSVLSEVFEIYARNRSTVVKPDPQFDIDPRWIELEEFAIKNNGVGVAARGKQLFPELEGQRLPATELPAEESAIYQGLGGPESLPDLPTLAPVLWADRNPGEHAGDFTRRVYGPWLGKGMTRNLLRKLDNPLFQALYRAYGSDLPDDLPLPTKKDENDRWVARVEEEGLAAVIPEGASPEFVLKEASRLAGARHRRRRD